MAARRSTARRPAKRPRLTHRAAEVQPRVASARTLREAALCFVIGFALAGGVVRALRAYGSGTASARAAARSEGGPAAAPISAAAQAQAAFERGYEHLRRERYAEAYREFYRATEFDPSAPEPQMGLAKVYEALDYDERAVAACRQAVAIDPAYHGARVTLARLLCDLGKNEESLALLQDPIRTDPNDPLVWAEIAVNELRLGNPRRAIPLLERYNRARGPQDWGYVHLGRAQADAGDTEPAERALRSALEIHSRSQLAHFWLGKLLAATERKEEAEPHFREFRRLRELETQQKLLEQAVAREPADRAALVSLLVSLARVRQLRGDTRAAMIPLERAAELAPDDPRVQELLARLRQTAPGPPAP